MIVAGDEHREYLQKQLGCELQPDAVFIANEEPYGVAGFERYTGEDIEIHFIGEPGFLTRAFLRCIAAYAFDQLGCNRITGRVPAGRSLAARRNLGKRLGFTHEGTLRKAHDGQDILIYGILREECKW